MITNPDIVATPKYGLLSAGWFWNSKGLNAIADTGSTLEVVTKITKRVNGGDKGLDDRWKHFQDIYKLMNVVSHPTPVVMTMPIKDLMPSEVK
jgi:putative chitinase